MKVKLHMSLGNLGVEKLTELRKNIKDFCVIPSDSSKLIFIGLPQKPGAMLCDIQ